MYLKIMGPEDVPDSDSRKTFRLVQCITDVKFERTDGRPYVSLTCEDGSRLTFGPIEGNVYVMNDQGKTIGSFGFEAYPKDGTFGHVTPPPPPRL